MSECKDSKNTCNLSVAILPVILIVLVMLRLSESVCCPASIQSIVYRIRRLSLSSCSKCISLHHRAAFELMLLPGDP
uniref:Uncharacterized protein n=1 Tax=Anopheles braziliensis TaxID=58242 RepID=A0A2M3ZLR7_9DIPT